MKEEKDYLTEKDIKFLPLHTTTELLELGFGNSNFKIYDNRIEIYGLYPFTVSRSFVLKTKEKHYQINVETAHQCGQSEFEATLKPVEKIPLRELVLKSLRDFHQE